MSAFVEEIPNAGGTDRRGSQGVGSDGDDDEDDDDSVFSGGDHGIGKRQHNSTRTSCGCGFGKEDMGKAKRVVLHQFTKAKNKLRRTRIKRVILGPSSSGNASTGSGKMMIRGHCTRTGCNFCLSRSQVLESPNGSPTTSDPNDPKFTHAMLKTLMEKNDFYSEECNPHVGLDVQYECKIIPGRAFRGEYSTGTWGEKNALPSFAFGFIWSDGPTSCRQCICCHSVIAD